MSAIIMLWLSVITPSQRALIEEMGQRSFTRRQMASWKLYELGPERATLALLAATRDRDLEIRKRAARILDEWRMERERELLIKEPWRKWWPIPGADDV